MTELTAERTPARTAGPTSAERNSPIDASSVRGWAVDADPKNDPTYPIRDRSKDEGLAFNWQRPRLQSTDVEILQSIEHRTRPAVVGTSTPPSGVSGMIRRLAFRWSESNWLHWLLLMGADRINVVEGVVQDLGRGKVPNIPAEMGVKAEWQHNKKGLATKLTVMAALGIAIYALTKRGKNEPRVEARGRKLTPPEVRKA